MTFMTLAEVKSFSVSLIVGFSVGISETCSTNTDWKYSLNKHASGDCTTGAMVCLTGAFCC